MLKQGCTILIVDDQPANRFALNELLAEREQFVIIEAESGEQALIIALEQRVDLILLDIQMPGMDGYETARYLGMTTATRDIPIIFITAVFKSEEFVKRGYEVGAIDYLTKPIDDNLLLNRVRFYLKLFDREKHLSASLQAVEAMEQALKQANATLELRVKERTDELVTANNALSESERRFHSLADATFEGIAITESGFIVEVNKTMSTIFGYSSDELISMAVLNLSAPNTRENVSEKMAMGYEKAYEGKGLRKDETLFPIEIHSKAFVYQGKTLSVTAIRDLTEKKEAEAEIKRLRGILPICSFCKKIRNSEGDYEQIEFYIHKKSGVDFSHTICPTCLKKHYS